MIEDKDKHDDLFSSLLAESFLMLKRGHSWLDPMCTCAAAHLHANTISTERRAQLGHCNFLSKKNELGLYCKAPSNRHMQSTRCIAHELGILNIHEAVVELRPSKTLAKTIKNVSSRKKVLPFMKALVYFGKYDVKYASAAGGAKEMFLSSSLCCIPEQVTCMDDIMYSLRILHPEPFLWTMTPRVSTTTTTITTTTQSLLEQQVLKQIFDVPPLSLPFYYVKHLRSTNEDPMHHEVHKSNKKRGLHQEEHNIVAVTFYLRDQGSMARRAVDDDIRTLWRQDANISNKRSFFSR